MQLLFLIKVVLYMLYVAPTVVLSGFKEFLSHTKLNTYVSTMSSYSLNVNIESKYPAPVQESVLTTC